MKTRGISDAGIRRLAQLQKTGADDTAWAMLETLREYMGDTDILEEIMHALSTDEAISNLECIARMHDIPLGGDEEESEEEEELDEEI